MSTLINLSSLLALVQDSIQRSYEYAEDIAELTRQDTDQEVTMAVSSLDLELPVSVNIQEEDLDLADVLNQAETSDAFQVAELRLIAPKLNASYKATLRDMTRSKYANMVFQNQGEALQQDPAEVADEVKSSKALNEEPADRPLNIRAARRSFQRQAVQNQQSKTEKSHNFMVQVLNSENLTAGDIKSIGRLKVSFKATLK